MRHSKSLWPIGLSLMAVPVLAQDVGEANFGGAVERHLPADQIFTPWVRDPNMFDAEQGDQLETQEVVVEEAETIKLTNLVPPIRFESGDADIPLESVDELRGILDGMRDRANVRLHLVGHADDQQLSPALAEIYGDNAGLSRERAGEVAELFQAALGLPPEAISFEGVGDSQPVAPNTSAENRALNRRVEVEVWYDEISERVEVEEVVVQQEIKRVKVCRVETVCKFNYVEGQARRARVQNLVAPLRFDVDAIEVGDDFIEQIRQAFDNLRDKQNVAVRFIGYTDDLPLAGRDERIYGNHEGLSRARARRVALAVQDALGLPTAAVESDGHGTERPLASNDTAQGRALNRRVEVEFWYDDPLAELPDEPQLCPETAGAETVTKVYDPPWGRPAAVSFVNGDPVIPAGYAAELRRSLQEVADKANVRVRFLGYTGNERLDRRTAMVYGDDIGLSAARARRVMEVLGEQLELTPGELEYEGRGYVHSDDVVNTGFVQGETSQVVVQVVYDELAVLDEYEGVDITRITRELDPQNPLGLNMMRITVDGEPVDAPGRSSSDIQRCTDVAMDQADIQFGFDNLQATPRLSVAADQNTTFVVNEPGGRSFGSPIGFKMYTNYSHFIERAEIRIFEHEQSNRDEPLEIVELNADGFAQWQPTVATLAGAARQLKYLLRVYDADGLFDETTAQPIWIVPDNGRGLAGGFADGIPAAAEQSRAAYGENALALQNIPVGSSSTVRVTGRGLPGQRELWFAGRPVPVDEHGDFVAEEILPAGAHSVEVAVLDEQGNGELYLRDLAFDRSDWFYVGMADLTIMESESSGPVGLLAGENTLDDYSESSFGRLAFYVNGKFSEQWQLTASADTQEGPLSDLFSNFMSKSPESLFRRIDPDYHYPSFGDDSVVDETAPTMGKFYVKLNRDDDYTVWGNFDVSYMNNELAQVDRGLYGGNLHYESESTTSFGERRFSLDGFAAEPGTVPTREEFRGTGGTLYFLHRQDVLPGSERIRVELRDKASGIVTGVADLTPVLDYDVDYLQGRILLAEPLASTADDNLLVRTGALSGDEAYLVVRYEYTPGFDQIDAISTGGQIHYWLGDRFKIGLTANANDQDNLDSDLSAADLTYRISANTWFKLQSAQTSGLLSTSMRSNDGGFGFYGYDDMSFIDADAGASRFDISIGFDDFFARRKGRLTLYGQELDAGYSAPGLATLTDTRNYGGSFAMPVTDTMSLTAKTDRRVQRDGLETNAQELNMTYRMNGNWNVGAGLRRDVRVDRSAAVPLTQEQGERTDFVVQAGYDSHADWRAYAFVQDSLSVTGDREENGQIGVGASYLITERLQLDGEISSGDLGAGGKIGTTYLHSDRTSLYLNYALENERTDNGLRANTGSEGNLVAGVKSRLSDSASVYLEERYQSGQHTAGLTHSAGISLAAAERVNMGANTDIGTLRDLQTGAEIQRTAAGFHVGYGMDAVQFFSGIEYRVDDTEQADTTFTSRTTLLFKNNFKFQMTPAARFLGQFNHSESESSLGQFYDGGFTEAVLGFAYRPIDNDRINALAKFTYFYNVPAADQVTLQDTSVEFIQRSQIAAFDFDYQLKPRWTVGGKYAYRVGEVSLDRANPVFFDNTAHLFILRADWEFDENWDAMVEARRLDLPSLNEQRTGALIYVSRDINDHIRVGAGYNFTDFSEDLTDLSFDHQGVFISLTGAM